MSDWGGRGILTKIGKGTQTVLVNTPTYIAVSIDEVANPEELWALVLEGEVIPD